MPPDQSSHAGIRDLEWGQINFIHSTDTHGWLAGHGDQDLREFSATWGDYVSFIHHMREMAEARNVDLIVVDTGDKYDGNGVSDGTVPSGLVIPELFMNADVDVILTGNHELYKPHVTELEYNVVRPHYGNRYLASNIDVLHNGEWVPLGSRYRVFTTPVNGIKVLAFGFLFNFQGGSPSSRVMKIEEAVKQNWFKNALRTPGIDMILLAGHIPVRYYTEFDTIVAEIRKVLPRIPIQGFGGHSHIRDYRVYDEYAVALESGRFLETIGWASIDNVHKSPPKFTRRYIDFNQNSLAHHSKKVIGDKCNPASPSFQRAADCFDTEDGLDLNGNIEHHRHQMNLTEVFCEVPHSYYMTRAKYPSSFSIFSLIEDKVLPLLNGTVGRNELPRYIIVNTGSIRYDLIAGNFTKDTRYILSPFVNKWNYIPNVPIDVAKKVAPLLNREQSVIAMKTNHELELGQLNVPSQRRHRPSGEITTTASDTETSLPGGYVTYDDLGNEGDDTPHSRWGEYPVPNVVQCEDNVRESTETVDLIFADFLIPFIAQIFQAISRPDLLLSMAEYGGQQLPDLFIEHFCVNNQRQYDE